MGRNAAPHRQFNRRRKPALRLAEAKIETLAADMQARIRRSLMDRDAGTMVICDPEGLIYFLAAYDLAAEQMANQHPEWVVGVYAERTASGAPTGVPDTDVLADDLRACAESLGIQGCR